jgi:hypothetical protein
MYLGSIAYKLMTNRKVYMEMKFIRNIQFTKLIKANGRLREFNFRKSNNLGDGTFTIDVSDDRGNRIVFHMEKSDNFWKIKEQQLPPWIWEIEIKLDELIGEELVNESNS